MSKALSFAVRGERPPGFRGINTMIEFGLQPVAPESCRRGSFGFHARFTRKWSKSAMKIRYQAGAGEQGTKGSIMMGSVRFTAVSSAFILLGLMVATTSCGGGSGGGDGPGEEPPPEVDISGDWSGAWTDAGGGDSGEATFFLTQTGTSVSGTVSVIGDECLSTGNVTGTVSGDSADMTIQSGAETVVLNVTIDGSTMSGTWDYTASGSPECAGATGRFSTTLTTGGAQIRW